MLGGGAGLDEMIDVLAARLGYVRSAGAGQTGFVLDPFIFHIDYTPAAANSITSGNFLVQADSAFAITRTTVIVSDTADAAVANLQPFGSGSNPGLDPFLVTMTDTGSGRALTSLPIPLDSLAGTGQFPYNWVIPKILDPNSTFIVTVQNLSATDRRVRMSFHGYKIFGDVQKFVKKYIVKPRAYPG